MTLPTAAQIIEQSDALAAARFKHEMHSVPETNERTPYAFIGGVTGGLGMAFGGSALAISAGLAAHGGFGHNAIFYGGLAIGLMAGAAIGWVSNDSVEEAKVKLEDTTQKIDALDEHVSTREDLGPKFSQLLMDRRAQVDQRLTENEKFKKKFSEVAKAGIVAGAAASIVTGPR